MDIQQHKSILCLSLIVFILAACTLNAVETPEPTGQAVFVPTQPVALPPTTPQFRPEQNETTANGNTTTNTTNTGISNPQSSRPNTTAATSSTSSSCTPRADWPLYTVVAGDTLGTLARRTNSTVSQLASANCLADPNLISVGQRLRVPMVPASQPPPTIVPTAQSFPIRAGSVTISPVLRLEGDLRVLQTGTTVSLVWSQAPTAQVDRVDFMLTPTGTNTTASLIGTDSYLADGAGVAWMIPAALSGYISAIGRKNGVETARTLSDVLVYAEGNPPPPAVIGQVTISPADLINGKYLIKGGTNVTLTWADGPKNAHVIEFYFVIPAATPTQPIKRELLGSDSYPVDGASFTWPVPIGFSTEGTINAVAKVYGSVVSQTKTDVPVAPKAAEPPPTIGQVAVSPASVVNFTYIITSGTTVTLTWSPMPRVDANSVEFYLLPPSPSARAQGMKTLIGTDNNLADGASISWAVPVNTQSNFGYINAVAKLNGAIIFTTAVDVEVAIEPPPNSAGQVDITPVLRYENAAAVLQAGTLVTLAWTQAPTTKATSVSFYVTPAGTGTTPVLIGTDVNMADGASLTWTVPDDLLGSLKAVAQLSGGGTFQTAIDVQATIER